MLCDQSVRQKVFHSFHSHPAMRLQALFFCLLAISWQASAESRTWTNISGKTITAEMIASDKTTVSLQLPNGKTAKIPINTLSPEDRLWIAEQNKPGRPNFNAPWPDSAEIEDTFEVTTIENGPEKYIYETPHFQFTCDARLGSLVIKRLAFIFEATYEANRRLPINNAPISDPDYKFQAYLFEKRSDYHRAGGTPETAGMQIWRPSMGKFGRVIVPFESLGVKKVGKAYAIDYKDDDIKTLIHEITHLLMTNETKQEAWFCEGSAEYVGLSPYRTGKFNFKANRRPIMLAVTAFGVEKKRGRNLGKNIKATSLKRLMTMSYRDFVTGPSTNQHYGLAPLLVYFFYHVDGKGDGARIKKYVEALQKGASPDMARELLLDGRDWNKLADEISSFWKRNGVTIEFES